MTQLPKTKPRAGVPKKLKRRHCEIRARRRWQGSKIKVNVAIFLPLEKVDSFNFYPKIERIEGMTLY